MTEEIVVKIDEDMSDIVPQYLENKVEDIKRLQSALEEGDFETIRLTGHDLKGTGAGYGFDKLTEIGAALETAGKDGDGVKAKSLIESFADYVTRVRVVYE